MSKQFKLFETQKKKSRVLDEEGEAIKFKWSESPGHWKTRRVTKKEHVCSRCELRIPVGSSADVTLDFDGPRPKREDFKNVKYWHLDKQCLQKNIEDEPEITETRNKIGS